MAHFMDVHHGMHGITADQLDKAHQADLAIEKDEDVHFGTRMGGPWPPARSTACPRPHRPTPSNASHERAGHKADEIHEVPLTV